MTVDKRERVVDKLAKLKAMAESAERIGNEAEAQAFAEKFQRMLLEHKIDVTEVDLAQEEAAEPVTEHWIDYGKYPDVPLKSARSEWTARLAHIVSKAHFCSFLVYRGSSRISFIGRKSDAAVAEYAFITLYRATLELSKREHARFAYECYKHDGHCANARGFKESFIVSFITRLAQRYADVRDQVASSSSTALVRVNRAEAAVIEYVNAKDEKGKPKIKTIKTIVRHRGDVNVEGHRRGRAAADRINLDGKAVTAAPNVRGVLR